MTDNSPISSGTLAAYRTTDYHVHTQPPFVLHVDQHSPRLLQLHAIHGVNCSAYVTAWNPHGRRLDTAQNEARQKQLMTELARRKLAFVPGVGKDATDSWAEESVLVLGASLPVAQALGQAFEQNAVLWCGADAVPQLVLLR